MTTVPASRTVRLGTRGSALALAQTEHVATLLRATRPDLEIGHRIIRTRGDADSTTPLPAIGGKGVFTEELERALRDGEIDAAVHSLKDLPVAPAPGLAIAAICAREDAREALVSRGFRSLATLPAGAVVGTSSLRRTAQLLALRSDLVIRPLRGNVETRVAKAGGAYDAVVLAAAGLLRLGLGSEIVQLFPIDEFLPAPGQGALAVQCRADDRELLAVLGRIDDQRVRAATTAERSFLAALGGGCSLPVAAFANVHQPNSTLLLRGLVASANGGRIVRVTIEGAAAEAIALGERLAAEALAAGARELLE
jgi:hydroxymethylbilane synthase